MRIGNGMKRISLRFYVAFIVLGCASWGALAQQVPPGAKAVAKLHVKPFGKNSMLFEVINFDCPSQIKSSKGRQKFVSALKREFGRALCSSLSGPITSEKVRFTYCHGSVVLAWTVTAKFC